jgi:hypothetical protein
MNHKGSSYDTATTLSIMKKKLTVGTLSFAAILLISSIIIGRSAIGNLLSGNVHFSEDNIGHVLKMKDGQNYTIFSWLKVDGKAGNPANFAVFKVRFKFKNLSNQANKRLSIIPAPFLIGIKGFQEKIWTINESTNDFQGIYQWSSKEMAIRYPDTFIFKLMTKRAAPGTVSYEIIPNTDLTYYVAANRIN